jgi:hypothetical protein
MKIVKLTGNDCGGFRPPKGHLDTQMFPECEGTETDRNIVKKTVERRNKKHHKKAEYDNWYKKAQMEGDDPADVKMKRLNETNKEKITKLFKENFPNMTATFEEMYNWYLKNIVQKPKGGYDWEAHQKRDFERARQNPLDFFKKRTRI